MKKYYFVIFFYVYFQTYLLLILKKLKKKFNYKSKIIFPIRPNKGKCSEPVYHSFVSIYNPIETLDAERIWS